jgi:hypothetical protein
MGILKFDASANLSWAKQYSELSASDAASVIQTSDGGYLLPGRISSDRFFTSQAYLVKTDASGNVEWSKRYFNSSFTFIYDLEKTNDNNYVFLAHDENNSSDSACVVKVNSTGNVIWCRYFFSSSEYVDGYGLTPTSDGGYVITGETHAGNKNGFVLKIDGDGNYKWSKSTNAAAENANIVFNDVVETSDGGYVAAGQYYSSGSVYFYFLKLNNAGDLVWTKRLSYGDGYNALYRLIRTMDGGYIAIGTSAGGGQPENGLFIKFDANFNTCYTVVSTGTIINFGSFTSGNISSYAGNTTVTDITPAVASTGSVINACFALPLTLISFNASLQNKIVTIQWKTTHEINTSYFDIEKSADGRLFNAFTRVAASGNSNVVKSYLAADDQPLPGESWYRLKMVDKDGAFTYSNQVKITANDNTRAVLYPNPALNYTELNLHANAAVNYMIRTTDISGRILQTLTGMLVPGNNKIKLNIAGFSKGMYVVSFTAEGQQRITLKLNKQ